MWLDTAHNCLVHDTVNADRIKELIPEAIRLANGYVATPITLPNLQLLRWLKEPVIPPMSDYDWPLPKKWKPLAHQQAMANFMVLHPRSFNLSDMGTMKTQSALWAADYVMQRDPMKCLIVSPLSTLERVWADGIWQSFMGRRKCVVLHGTADKRKRLLAEDADFYIVNFDGLRVIQKDLEARKDIRMVIVDEASAYRDRSTDRHRIARKLIMHRDYVWLMTGTPTSNGPLDAYGLSYIINRANGESFANYQMRVMEKTSLWKWEPRRGAMAEAHKLLQPSIRFAIEDCVDLPPNTVQMRDVELSPEQAKAYKSLKQDAVLMMRTGQQITAVNEAVLRLKLIQVSCGAVYGKDRAIEHVDVAPRLKVLREVMGECKEKIIVFAPLTSVLHMLKKELKEYSTEIVNGEVPASKRNRIFSDFTNGDRPRVLLADPATMSHGLTLTAATCIVWYGPIDRTEIYLQANKRIDRPGQTKATTIVQLAATPLERGIYKRLTHNQNMQGLLLELVKGQLQ